MRANLILLLVSTFLSLEAVGYVSGKIAPEMYGRTAADMEWLKSWGDPVFQIFLRTEYSPAAGWEPSPNLTYNMRNCVGEDTHYSYDAYGARTYKGYDRNKATVLLIGDSYTHSLELKAEDSIAAQMFRRTGIVSANLGVPVYSPVQAFTRLQVKRQYYPHARVVILGIMDENIDRMPNGFGLIYFDFISTFMGYFRPYMQDGKLHPLDTKNFSSWDAYLKAAHEAFLNDYWARPPYQFPYSLALIRAVTSHSFIDKTLENIMERSHRRYWFQYHDKKLGDDLFALLTLYAQWAEKEKLVPVAVFLPKNKYDSTSPQYWIDQYASRLPSNLIVQNMALSQADYGPYNLNSNPRCHPSVFGAGKIAARYETILKDIMKEPPHPGEEGVSSSSIQ